MKQYDSIIKKIIARQDVSTIEVKYLLWLAYTQLLAVDQSELPVLDEEEGFDFDQALDALDLDLDLLP